MNTAKVEVGRLLEVRVAAGFRTVAHVDALFDAIDRALGVLGFGQRHVTVADWRLCPVMSPEAAQRLSERIGIYNTRTDRSAALASRSSPVAVLQFVRVIRETGLPDRKLFYDEKELIDWVDQVLTPGEQARLREFLSEGRQGG